MNCRCYMCVHLSICQSVSVTLCVRIYVCLCMQYNTIIIQQEVLDIARDLLEEINTDPSTFGDSTDLERKLKQTKAVLEMCVQNPPIL